MSTNFVSRSNWGARHPKAAPTRLSNALGVALHWEGVTMGKRDHGGCDDQVRQIQSYHMDKNKWNDIAYNFLVCQHGTVFEGRGVNVRSAANGTNESNSHYYAVCALMGPGDAFPNEMRTGLLDAIEICRGAGFAKKEVVPHRRFISTQCPGDPVVSWIDTGAPGSPTIPPGSFPPPSDDWFEGFVMNLPTLDFNNVSSLNGNGLVDNVQGLLNGAQFDPSRCAIDGVAGPKTLNAVKAFQQMKGIKIDGVVGPSTWRALITH